METNKVRQLLVEKPTMSRLKAVLNSALDHIDRQEAYIERLQRRMRG